MRMLFEIDIEGADPVDYVAKVLAEKLKISGFGLRVYHTEDPRARPAQNVRTGRVLETQSGLRCRARSKSTCLRRRNSTRIDFYSASTYTILGIDLDLFTPIFAVSRISGWAAHVIEQLDDNRLIRRYAGGGPDALFPTRDREALGSATVCGWLGG